MLLFKKISYNIMRYHVEHTFFDGNGKKMGNYFFKDSIYKRRVLYLLK